MSGDARRAAHSSADLDPVAGSLPLSWVCPTAIPEPTRHLSRLWLSPRPGELQCRLTCTGLWTERRTCPRSRRRLLGASARSACAWRTLTTFPSSFFQRTPAVAGAFACWGRAPNRRDGPTKTRIPPPAREGWRHLTNQGAFHRCDESSQRNRRIAPTLPRHPRRSSAHAAHTLFPWLGTMCF